MSLPSATTGLVLLLAVASPLPGLDSAVWVQDQAQDKKSTKQGKQGKQEKKPGAEKPGAKKPGAKKPGGATDETDAAAEALRRLFERLKAGKARPTEDSPPGKVWKIKPKQPTVPGKVTPEPPAAKKPQPNVPVVPETRPLVVDPQGKKTVPPATKPTPDTSPHGGRDDPEEVVRRMREQAARRQHPGAAPGEQPAVVQPQLANSAPPGPRVDAWLTLRQRYRRADGKVKQDTLGLLGVDVGDAERDLVSAHLLARGFLDTSSRNGADSLGSLDHAAGERYTGRLYQAHVDLHRSGPFRLFRLGRQTLFETPEVLLLDGLAVETEARGRERWVFGAHAGVPAQLFESSASGDLALGMHLGAQLWRGGRWRLDYMHIDDRRILTDADDDLLSLAAWQRFGEHANLHVRYSRLEGQDRDLRVRGHYQLPDLELDLRVTYDELLETQGALAAEFDPFNQALLEYHPYRQLGISLTQQLSDTLAWDLGVNLRRLSRDNDEGQFNRDFDRGFLAMHYENLWVEGSSLSLHLDAYTTSRNDTFALGLDYRAPLGEALEFSLGSLYSQYKYDFVSQRERDSVRTWFGGLHYRAGRGLRVSLDYSFETGPFPDSHSAEVRLRWQF